MINRRFHNVYNLLVSPIKRQLSTVREKNEEVELASSIIQCTTEENKGKHMLFLPTIFSLRQSLRTIAVNPKISKKRTCHLLDLRNQGDSDYHEKMTYKVMADDVIRYADKKGIEKFTLLGHSIGGMVGMTLAPLYSERIDGLIAIESPPKDANNFQNFKTNISPIFEKLRKINVSDKTRKEVHDMLLQEFGQNKVLTSYLEQNLAGKEDEPAKWKVNMSAILNNEENLLGFTKFGEYKGPVLLIFGEKSFGGILQSYTPLFPELEETDLVEIEEAGHFVHNDKPQEVIKKLESFLEKIDAIKCRMKE